MRLVLKSTLFRSSTIFDYLIEFKIVSVYAKPFQALEVFKVAKKFITCGTPL